MSVCDKCGKGADFLNQLCDPCIQGIYGKNNTRISELERQHEIMTALALESAKLNEDLERQLADVQATLERLYAHQKENDETRINVAHHNAELGDEVERLNGELTNIRNHGTLIFRHRDGSVPDFRLIPEKFDEVSKFADVFFVAEIPVRSKESAIWWFRTATGPEGSKK